MLSRHLLVDAHIERVCYYAYVITILLSFRRLQHGIQLLQELFVLEVHQALYESSVVYMCQYLYEPFTLLLGYHNLLAIYNCQMHRIARWDRQPLYYVPLRCEYMLNRYNQMSSDFIYVQCV